MHFVSRYRMPLFVVTSEAGVGLVEGAVFHADASASHLMELAAGLFVKILCKVLGAGIDLLVEGGQVVDHEVVEIVDSGAHYLLKELEIEKHTCFVEFFADQGDEDLVVVAMRIFALTSVVAEVMAGRKAGFYGYFKHESGNPFDLSVAASGGVRVG